jgi:hypothetical protein
MDEWYGAEAAGDQGLGCPALRRMTRLGLDRTSRPADRVGRCRARRRRWMIRSGPATDDGQHGVPRVMRTIKLCATTARQTTTLLEAIRRSAVEIERAGRIRSVLAVTGAAAVANAATAPA